MSSDGGCVSKSFAVRCDGDKVKLIVTQGEANPSRLAPMEKGACPSGAFNALGHAGSAVDYLERLAECLDTCDLASLAGTCHALRDGRFTRAQCGKQCLQSELHKRRRHCIHTFELKLGLGSFEGEVLDLRQDGVADSDQRRLTAADARVLAGLFMQHPADVKPRTFHFPECDPMPISVFAGETYKLRRNNARCRNRNLDIAFLTKILVYNVMTSLDLSFNMLRAEGAKTLVDGGAFKGSLTSLKLAYNNLRAEGAKALVDGGAFTGSLTSIDLGYNSIGEEQALNLISIFINKKNMVSVGLTRCALPYGSHFCDCPAIAKPLADYISVAGSLTSIDVCFNGIIGDAAQELATVALSKPTLETFCNIPIKQLRADELTELNLSQKGVGVLGALVLAELLPVSASLTSINLAGNVLTDYGRDMSGIKALAPAIRDSGSLTSVSLIRNDFNPGEAAMLLKVKDEHPKLKTLCGLTHEETELNFRRHGLRTADLMLIAPELGVIGSLTSINLAENIFDPEAGKALAPAIRDSGSLASINLSSNNLFSETGYVNVTEVEGTSFNEGDKVIYQGYEMTISQGKDEDDEIIMIDISDVEALASAIAVSSLTSINLAATDLSAKGAKVLMDRGAFSGSLTSINLSKNELDAEAANVLAPAIAVASSLTACDLRHNSLNEHSKQLLRESVNGRPSFKLEL